MKKSDQIDKNKLFLFPIFEHTNTALSELVCVCVHRQHPNLSFSLTDIEF